MHNLTIIEEDGDYRVIKDGTPTNWRLCRGDYVDQADNNIDRWYADRDDAPRHRDYPGYPSREVALAVLIDDV